MCGLASSRWDGCKYDQPSILVASTWIPLPLDDDLLTPHLFIGLRVDIASAHSHTLPHNPKELRSGKIIQTVNPTTLGVLKSKTQSCVVLFVDPVFSINTNRNWTFSFLSTRNDPAHFPDTEICVSGQGWWRVLRRWSTARRGFPGTSCPQRFE